MINSFWLLLCFLLTAICSAKEENCDNMALDLGLVIDSSGSIGRRNWERMKYFAKDLISNVFMSINDTRISIIVYSTSPSFELSFNQPYSSERVDNLRYQRGYTYIDKALIMANQSMFTEKNGMRIDSTKVAIVFTDGFQTKRPGDVTTPLNVAADVLSKRAIDVFAVGIGRNIDVNELLDIASSAGNVYRAVGFYTLDVLINQVVSQLCHLNLHVKVQVKFHKTRTNGTVYITRDGTTLPLCEDNWDVTKSKLACKSEGYPDGSIGPALETTYQSHNVSFWKVEFKCTGLEDDLQKCNVTTYHTTTSCKHVATVSCRVYIELRSEGRSNKYYNSGQVFVLFRNIWGPVCRDTWGLNEANVVCKDMFNETAIANFEQGNDQEFKGTALISDLNCLESEKSLMDCQFKTYPEAQCSSTIPSTLVCRPKNVASAEDITWSIGETILLKCEIDETVQDWIFGGSKINQTEDFEIDNNKLTVKEVRSAYGGIYICRGMTRSRLFRVVVQLDAEATNTKQEMVYGEVGFVECKADGTPKPTYSWSYNSSSFPSENLPVDNGNGLLVFRYVTPEHAGEYRCILRQVTGRQSRQKVKVIMVSVYGQLAFTEIPPSNLTVYQGQTKILNCSAFSWPLPTITWTINGQVLEKKTSSASLTITVDVERGTEYTCVAKSTKSEIKAKTTLRVHPVIKSKFTDETRLLNQSYRQSCDAIGSKPLTVWWTKYNASNVSSGPLKVEGNTLSFKKLRLQDSGDYRCTVVNPVGKTWKSLRLKVLPNYPSKESSGVKSGSTSSDVRWYVIVGSIGGLVILVLLIIAVVWMRKRNVNTENVTAEELKSFNDPWEFPRKQLVILEAIGKGAFGEVCKAIARGLEKGEEELVVAVKQAKTGDFIAREALEQEIKQGKALGAERHPHICNFLGCVTLSEPITIICEFAEHGDLLDFLHKCIGEHQQKSNEKTSDQPLKILAAYDLTKFCIQIASGMSYLHSKGVIHRDLAARNVLVAEGYVCKITDFGLAVERGHYGYATEAKKGQLPIKWSAPELLFETEYKVTAKIDVWSYGILMYEIFTIGESPYPRWPVYQVLCELQQNNYRMAKPDHVSDFIYHVMCQCWQNNPKDRPSFDQIHSMLVGTQSEEYLDLVNYDPSEHEPKTEPNVDSELKKPKLFVASNDIALVKSGDNAGPSTENNCNDKVVPLTSVSVETE